MTGTGSRIGNLGNVGFVEHFFVYIMSNDWRTLYVGMTNNLSARVHEHQGALSGFVAKHSIHRLVYYEALPDAAQAISREKRIKGWKRFRKIALIDGMNPEWKDLSGNLF